MSFVEALRAATQRNKSLLCVGIDPDVRRLPAGFSQNADGVYRFCVQIAEATADLVCAFKPNIAFFEALGPSGVEALRRLLADMPRTAPVIVDAKRGDIDSTAAAYAEALFERLGADAVTLNPYLGRDALQPFLRYADKGCIILCKTSNPGSADLQDLKLANGNSLYIEVARRVRDEWNSNGNAGLVVGATFPEVIAEVRAECPDLPLLVPGVGAQGGALAAATAAAADANGERAIISASRGVLYASSGSDFADAARAAAIRLRDEMNAALMPLV